MIGNSVVRIVRNDCWTKLYDFQVYQWGIKADAAVEGCIFPKLDYIELIADHVADYMVDNILMSRR